MSDSAELISLTATIAVAFLGYIVTYVMKLRLARREDRLELVDRRLGEFYGPLYIACEAGEHVYRVLCEKLRPGLLSDDVPTAMELGDLDEAEFEEWRRWCATAFIPLNDIRERLIFDKAYLISEEEPPRCLVDFVAHATAMKALFHRWQSGALDQRVVDIPFPPDLLRYAREHYGILKQRQVELLKDHGRRRRQGAAR